MTGACQDTTEITTIRLESGMVLVAERIPSVASAAVSWLIPAGSASDPVDGDGQASLLAELVFRGAGGMTSREHSDALDRLGLQRSTDVRTHHMRVHATMLGDRLPAALPLLAAMVRQPALPADALDAVRSLCIQSLESLDDDPQHLVMLRLRERHMAPPFNRHGYGEPEVLERATAETLRDAWATRWGPRRAIFAVAGDVDPHGLADQLNELLKGWAGGCEEPRELGPPQRGSLTIEQPTAQVHIGLAYDAPPEVDEHSMTERVAIGVLSGSTSGRLFTEVRQKRSLCYSVGASYRAGRDTGLISLYAGTTPQRAQETLDVCIGEFRRLRDGVGEDEFKRAVTGIKSSLVMQGESTPARAAALGSDQHRLGRARSLDELAAAVDRVTLSGLNAYLAERSFGEATVVSIGPAALEPPTA